MPDKHAVNTRLTEILDLKGAVLLDGATGTELEHRGYRTSAPLWTAEAAIRAPEMLGAIHRAYLRAGVDILSANTFRTTPGAFAKAGQPDGWRQAVTTSVHLAREMIREYRPGTLLAGVIAPLEDCFAPGLTPTSAIAMETAHGIQVQTLVDLGVDFILAETLGTLRETVAIAKTCYNKDIPLMVSFRSTGAGTLPDGTPLVKVCTEIGKYQPLAMMLNCNTPKALSGDLAILLQHRKGLIGVYPNAPGHFVKQGTWAQPPGGLEQYLAMIGSCLDMGAAIVGGCCGTGPAHLEALSRYISTRHGY